MKHIIPIFITFSWLISIIMAQQPNDALSIKDKVNAIKLDKKYQYEEVQDSVKEEAEEYAFQLLLQSVNESRKEKGMDSLLQKHLFPYVKILSFPRHTLFKGFAYVETAEIDTLRSGIPFSKYFDAANLSSGKDEARVPNSNLDSVAAIPIKVTQSPADSLPPPIDSTGTGHEGEPGPRQPLSDTLSMNKIQVMMSLKTMEKAEEVYNALGQFKEKNSISDYGMVNDTTSLEANDYVIVYDREQFNKIQSIIQKTELNKFRGTGFGALWFRFK